MAKNRAEGRKRKTATSGSSPTSAEAEGESAGAQQIVVCAICRDSKSCPLVHHVSNGSAGSANHEQQREQQPSFTLRCNSCRMWYHPWCLGYQLDLDRGCMVTATEIDIPLDPSGTGLPSVSQWFCDTCTSTETGVVGCLAKRPR